MFSCIFYVCLCFLCCKYISLSSECAVLIPWQRNCFFCGIGRSKLGIFLKYFKKVELASDMCLVTRNLDFFFKYTFLIVQNSHKYSLIPMYRRWRNCMICKEFVVEVNYFKCSSLLVVCSVQVMSLWISSREYISSQHRFHEKLRKVKITQS